MKIRQIVFWASVFLLVLVSLTYWGVSWAMMSRQYDEMERWVLREDLHRLRRALGDLLNSQAKMNRDYAQWDATYQWQFNPRDSQYIRGNLQWNVFANMGIEHFLILDMSGKVRAHVGADIHGAPGDTLAEPRALLESLDWRSAPFARADSQVSMWIQPTAEGSFLVTADRITRSDCSADERSVLLFARRLDSAVIAGLQDRVRQNVRLETRRAALGSAQILDRSGKRAEEDILYQSNAPEHPGISTGYLLTGRGEGVLLRLDRPRQIELIGFENLKTMFWVLLFGAVVIIGAAYYLMGRFLLTPLEELEARFARIGESGDLGIRMPVMYSQELQSVARTINTVLDRLQESQRQLWESEQQQRALVHELRNTHQFLTQVVNFLPDATFAVDAKGIVVAWNRSMEDLTGSNVNSMLGQSLEKVQKLIYGASHPLLMEVFFQPDLQDALFAEARLEDGAVRYEEFVAQLDHRQGRFLDQTAIALRDSSGKFLGAMQTIRDVTHQRRAEMRLEFLSLHDPLTGLYNRTYFNQVGETFTDQVNLPVALIVADLDGLKLVNDTLGHDHGDALLVSAADLLKKCFADLPLVRLGGDEFVVMWARVSEETVRERLEEFRRVIRQYNEGNPPLPVEISLGYAASAVSCALGTLFKEADGRMYREKDTRREAVRLGYVTALQRRFAELHRNESNITERLADLVSRFASFLGYSGEMCARLDLLARYRDIGKVGLSERVLLKSGGLSEEELKEIRKQPEIGYRIARISRELAPIAELILKQREWWNGQGYPLGLSGEKIPLENRLVAVVEAYVVMTGPRHRSRSLSPQEALSEIRAMAGKKLDPHLVIRFEEFLAGER